MNNEYLGSEKYSTVKTVKIDGQWWVVGRLSEDIKSFTIEITTHKWMFVAVVVLLLSGNSVVVWDYVSFE